MQIMRLTRVMVAGAALLLAACAGNSVGSTMSTGSWEALLKWGSGPAEVTLVHRLTLEGDGRFTWNRLQYGDGTRPGDFAAGSFQAGRYRIRNGFLEMRVTRTGGLQADLTRVREAEVQNPRWTMDEYRMATTGDRFTLRFIPPESSSRTPVTLEFTRIRPAG